MGSKRSIAVSASGDEAVGQRASLTDFCYRAMRRSGSRQSLFAI